MAYAAATPGAYAASAPDPPPDQSSVEGLAVPPSFTSTIITLNCRRSVGAVGPRTRYPAAHAGPEERLTALVAAFVLAVTAAPAAAAEEEGRDAAGDVRSRGVSVDTVPRHPEPQRRTGDIVRYGATYDAALVVTTKFRDLAARGHQEFTWFLLTSQDDGEWTSR